MTEIIISLTTTSERINTVHKTIYSLLRQKTKYNFSIRLYISKESYLIDRGIQSIPFHLQNILDKYSIFNIYYTDNLGSYRKLLPVLKEKWDKDVIIITVDDDKIYKKDLVNKLVNNFIKHNGKYIIANRAFLKWNNQLSNFCEEILGINDPLKKIIHKIVKKNRIAQNTCFKLGDSFEIINKLAFLEGNDGVLYHTSFFNPIVLDWGVIKKIAKNHDDFWFKLCCLINNVGVICINPFENRISKQIQNTQQTGLHQNINKGSYQKELAKMCRWFFE